MAPTIEALLDSNVVVAVVVAAHEHHVASIRLLADGRQHRFAIAAHSYAEAYSTLTRQGTRAQFQFTAAEAWAALKSLRAVTALVGLTPQQTLDAIEAYAKASGTGPRLYDCLIGQAATTNGIACLITWNVRHMRGLFPALDVRTPGKTVA